MSIDISRGRSRRRRRPRAAAVSPTAARKHVMVTYIAVVRSGRGGRVDVTRGHIRDTVARNWLDARCFNWEMTVRSGESLNLTDCHMAASPLRIINSIDAISVNMDNSCSFRQSICRAVAVRKMVDCTRFRAEMGRKRWEMLVVLWLLSLPWSAVLV